MNNKLCSTCTASKICANCSYHNVTDSGDYCWCDFGFKDGENPTACCGLFSCKFSSIYPKCHDEDIED